MRENEKERESNSTVTVIFAEYIYINLLHKQKYLREQQGWKCWLFILCNAAIFIVSIETKSIAINSPAERESEIKKKWRWSMIGQRLHHDFLCIEKKKKHKKKDAVKVTHSRVR